MANFNTEGLSELVGRMERLGEGMNVDLVNKMLDAGAEVVELAWRQATEDAGHIFSRQMYESIGFAAEPKKLGEAFYKDVYPQGTDTKTGVRNMEKAMWAHYGRHNSERALKRRHYKYVKEREGSFFVDKAEAMSWDHVVPAMEAVFDNYIYEKG